MPLPTTENVECDILIIGGGMSGCVAAFEAKYWSRDLKVVLVEKAVIERSGATGRKPPGSGSPVSLATCRYSNVVSNSVTS